MERMLTRKVWDHVIEVKERFVLRKGYIWPSKSSQIVPVFFVRKKDGKN